MTSSPYKRLRSACINALLTLGTFSLLLYEAHLLTRAEVPDPVATPASAQAPAKNSESSRCKKDMKAYMDREEKSLGDFLNTHLASEKPTSELSDVAVERVREFRAAARAKMESLLFVPPGKVVAEDILAQRPVCEDFLRQRLDLTLTLVRQNISTNAFAKKTTRLLNASKHLNERLDRLNFEIAQTYGYFSAFSQKLPCFAEKCTGK